MVRKNKNISKLFIIAFLILTFIQLGESKWGRGRSRGHGSSSGSKGSGGWFSSWFKSSSSTSHNTGSSKPKPIGWNVDSSKPVRSNSYPSVQPPAGAPSHHNAYPYSAQPLPGHQSVGGYRPPPPPPPPGFLNSPHTSGAAPSYTYYNNYYYSGGSSNNHLLASLAMWEILNHRSHYNVYTTTKHFDNTSVNKVPETSAFEPGKVYLVAPNNVTCSISAFEFNIYLFIVKCDSGSSLNLTIILPSNKTSFVECDKNIFETKCFGRKTFTVYEMSRVTFKVFNPAKVYGDPLCNTTVVSGFLTVDNATELNNSTACIYPPYKWTGKIWSSIYEEEKKEKIKKNLHSVYKLTKLENMTLKALFHATFLGKLYNLLTINKNKS